MLSKLRTFYSDYISKKKTTGDNHEIIDSQISGMRQLAIIMDDSTLDYIDLSVVDLNEETYSHVYPGVEDRIITGPRDIKYEFESEALPYLESLDFKIGTVLLAKIEAGTLMKKHFHLEDESVRVVKGLMIEKLSGVEIKPGENIYIKSLTPHEMFFPEDTFCVLKLIPKLKKLK